MYCDDQPIPIRPSDVITSAGHQLAAILYYLGYIAVETDEPSTGEQLLEECLRTAPALGPCTVLSTLNALNQLGLVWSRRGEHNRSQHYLQTAETIYQQYKEQITLKVRLDGKCVMVFLSNKMSPTIGGQPHNQKTK